MSLALAMSSAALTFLVGPLLRVVFGGEQLQWSPLLDRLFGEAPSLIVVRSYLPWLIALVAGVKAISYFFERITRAFMVRATGRRLRLHIIHWAIQLSYDELEAFGKGDLQHRLTVDVERFEQWLDQHGASLIRESINVLALLLSAILVSGYIGLIILCLYPFLIIPILVLSQRLKRAANQQFSTAKSLHQWAHYTEDHLALLKALSHEHMIKFDLTAYHEKLEKSQSRLAYLQGLAPSVTELLVSLIIAVSLYGFTWGLDHGWWSAEELVSLFVCIIMLYQPVKSVGRAYQQWAYGQIILERCLCSLTVNLSDNTWAKKLETSNQHNDLDRLDIYYSKFKRGTKTFEWSRHMTYQSGHIYSIVGQNGVGKSSFFLALLGLIPAQIDLEFVHQGTEQISLNDLRIGWCSQPAQILINDLSKIYRSSTRIVEFEKKLKLFQFSNSALLEMKRLLSLSTTHLPLLKLWDWFRNLSQGEQQKLALSLSFSQSNLDLLLLDEPESHLDQHSIQTLSSLLNEHANKTIILMITHHSQLQNCSHHTYTFQQDFDK